MIIAAVLLQQVLDRVIGDALQSGIDRGAHQEHALVHRLRERVDELLHLVEGVVEEIVRRAVVAAIERHGGVAAGAEHLAFGHEPGFDQIVEHDVGAGAGGRQIDVRRELGRRLEHAGQHRGFGQVHVARGLVEIELRRGVDAERAAAEIGAVEIELQDLVLGQPRFQPQREERLLDLALDGALVGEEQVLGELLGDRGAALADAAGLGVGDERARGAGQVDAEMLVEAAVFGGERRLDQRVGEIRQRNGIVVLDAAAADFVAVAVEERHRELGLLQPVVVGGFAEGGQRQRQHQDEAAGAHGGRLRHRLDENPAPPAADVEAVHEHGEPLPDLARPAPGLEDEIVEAGVGIQQEAPELGLPLLLLGIGIELAQRRLLLEKPATLMASGGRLYLWVTFRPSWGGVPCRIVLKVNGFRGKIRLLPQFFTRHGRLFSSRACGCPFTFQTAGGQMAKAPPPLFSQGAGSAGHFRPLAHEGRSPLTNVRERSAERRG